MMNYPLIYFIRRKIPFTGKILAIIFSLLVLFIPSVGIVHSGAFDNSVVHSSNQDLTGVVNNYKISNSLYDISSNANSTLSGQNTINLIPDDLNIISGVSSEKIESFSPNTPLFKNYNYSIIESINSNQVPAASLSTGSNNGAVSLADISIGYTGSENLGVISEYFSYEANSTMDMTFKVTAQSGSLILFVSNGYTLVPNGFCTLNPVQINGNSIQGLQGTSIQGSGGIWSSICPAYMQVNNSGTFYISANFKSTDGAITSYVLVIGPEQNVNPPAITNTGQTNFPYMLLSAITIGAVISFAVTVYSFSKKENLREAQKHLSGNKI